MFFEYLKINASYSVLCTENGVDKTNGLCTDTHEIIPIHCDLRAVIIWSVI